MISQRWLSKMNSNRFVNHIFAVFATSVHGLLLLFLGGLFKFFHYRYMSNLFSYIPINTMIVLYFECTSCAEDGYIVNDESTCVRNNLIIFQLNMCDCKSVLKNTLKYSRISII